MNQKVEVAEHQLDLSPKQEFAEHQLELNLAEHQLELNLAEHQLELNLAEHQLELNLADNAEQVQLGFLWHHNHNLSQYRIRPEHMQFGTGPLPSKSSLQ